MIELIIKTIIIHNSIIRNDGTYDLMIPAI